MKQAKALDILKAGHNVFLTGSAGAGKTYTLNQYIRYLRLHKVAVAVTASTGIAATHTNGMTIHTWAGIGIKDDLSKQELAAMQERKYLRDHMENTKVLIIDEISMLHAKQLDLVNKVLKYFKENEEPFGGIQVVFSGDFFQLPPVGSSEETNRDKFAFMSKAWLEASPVICHLEEQHRQSDSRLEGILNEIRSGSVSEQSIALLRSTKEQALAQGLDAPKLYTHNADVDNINRQRLEALEAGINAFEAETKGNEKLVDLLKNTVRTHAKLELKKGAKVMFVKNNFEKGYINGSLGEVVSFVRKDDLGMLPKVKLRNGFEIIAEPETWSIDDETGKNLASFKQVPLRLAWAITVHKSQGMTLDAAEIDLSHTFERGQGYVALSRLKSLDGLCLLGLNRTALELDPLAMKADKRFKELSQQADLKHTHEDLQLFHKHFIVKSGGIINEKELQKRAKKLGEKAAEKEGKEKDRLQKKSTYLLTKELIDKGLKLEEIAEERGLSQGTIAGHFSKIFKEYPDTDFQRFKPHASVIKKVEKALKGISEQEAADILTETGSTRLKPIYEFLEGELGYDEIRLALFFAV